MKYQIFSKVVQWGVKYSALQNNGLSNPKQIQHNAQCNVLSIQQTLKRAMRCQLFSYTEEFVVEYSAGVKYSAMWQSEVPNIQLYCTMRCHMFASTVQWGVKYLAIKYDRVRCPNSAIQYIGCQIFSYTVKYSYHGVSIFSYIIQ